MLKVALTGNIASGKSCVQKLIEANDYKIIDADILAHKVLKEKKDEIINAFRNFDIQDAYGDISRIKLGEIVFNDNEMKQILESVVHKQILNKIEDFFISNKDENIVFAAIPLLFEGKMETLFDKIIFVSCSEDIRLKRLILRNNYTKEYALKRIAAQDKEENKIKKSDFVIYNNSDLESLKNQTYNILNKLASL